MPDISLCTQKECPIKAKCYRSIDNHPDDGNKRQSFLCVPSKETSENGCSIYWPYDPKTKER